jgi:hypothetical protein
MASDFISKALKHSDISKNVDYNLMDCGRNIWIDHVIGAVESVYQCKDVAAGMILDGLRQDYPAHFMEIDPSAHQSKRYEKNPAHKALNGY